MTQLYFFSVNCVASNFIAKDEYENSYLREFRFTKC